MYSGILRDLDGGNHNSSKYSLRIWNYYNIDNTPELDQRQILIENIIV